MNGRIKLVSCYDGIDVLPFPDASTGDSFSKKVPSVSFSAADTRPSKLNLFCDTSIDSVLDWNLILRDYDDPSKLQYHNES